MEEDMEKEIEPEAAKEEAKAKLDEEEVELRDEGLDRSASGQHLTIEDGGS